MKKYNSPFIIIILIIQWNNLLAQDTLQRPNYRKFEVELSGVAASSFAFVTPGFSISNNKHSGLFAPIFVSENEDGSTGHGLMLGYKFYPNQRDKRASLYFAYNFVFTKYDELKLNKTILFNEIGYGFELRFLESIYFLSECGVGYQYDSYYKSGASVMFKAGIKKRFRKK